MCFVFCTVYRINTLITMSNWQLSKYWLQKRPQNPQTGTKIHPGSSFEFLKTFLRWSCTFPVIHCCISDLWRVCGCQRGFSQPCQSFNILPQTGICIYISVIPWCWEHLLLMLLISTLTLYSCSLLQQKSSSFGPYL